MSFPATSLSPAELQKAARDHLWLHFTRMSGSGATCFALFDSEEERDAAADRVPREWWKLATFLR